MTHSNDAVDDFVGGTSDVPAPLASLSWLLGSWAGVGLGQYPTIEDFRFFQEITFATDGRPFIGFHSRSWLIDAEGERIRQSASEVGYIRPAANDEVEMLITHPTGITELYLGTVTVTGLENARITGARMELATDGVMRTGSAKPVMGGTRLYGLVNGELMWTHDMAAMDQPLQNHLAARLRPASV